MKNQHKRKNKAFQPGRLISLQFLEIVKKKQKTEPHSINKKTIKHSKTPKHYEATANKNKKKNHKVFTLAM